MNPWRTRLKALLRWSTSDIGLAIVVLLVIAVRFAEPVQDGDLFWHMAYAKQMIARHTLIPDHSIYSWTPASNAMIYCTWLADFLFLGLWRIGGFAAVFVFRYAAVLAMAGLWFNFARRCGLLGKPVLWLVLLLTITSSYVGTLTKPEIFSLLFFNLLVWLLFRAKLAVLTGKNPVPWLCALPPLFVLWVNCHGAFILAAPLLAAFIIGEIIHTRRRGPEGRLPLKPLLICFALCVLSSFATPYGWRYPAQLVSDIALGGKPRPDTVWNNAHRNVWAFFVWILPLPILLGAMIAIFLAACVRWKRFAKRRMDWSIVLAFLAYLPLFIGIVRTTYFLPPVFAAGVIYLLRPLFRESAHPGKAQAIFRCASLAAFAALALTTIGACMFSKDATFWDAFDVGDAHPNEEADFLEKQNLGPKLINLFNTGGYLLWRLWPQYKVMVDSRSFPYLSWFDDQYRFGNGEDFDATLAKYPAPIALIEMNRPVVWRQFLRSPDWRPVFYGRAAIVFQRADAPYLRPLTSAPAESLRHFRIVETAANAFTFTCSVGDYTVAWDIERQCSRWPLKWVMNRGQLRQMHDYHRAHQALAARDFDQAENLFRATANLNGVCDRDQMILLLLSTRHKAEGTDRTAIEDGLQRLAAPR